MYPIIEIFPGLIIYSFGLLMSVAFIVFFWLLHSFSSKRGLVDPVFSSLVIFTLSTIVFGRLFYFLTEWRDTKGFFMAFFSGESSFFEFMRKIFFMENYNLSLMGGVIGFFLVFWWYTRDERKNRKLYIDVIVLAFLAASTIGSIGAWLGGQIYGIPSDSLGLIHSAPNNFISYTIDTPILPLGLIYAIGSMFLFFLCLRLERQTHMAGYVGFLGLGLYGLMLVIGEFWNGSEDMFQSIFGLNLSQIGGLIFIGYSIWFFISTADMTQKKTR